MSPRAAAIISSCCCIFIFAACGASSNSAPHDGGTQPACVPGQQINCGCPGGSIGVQDCSPDGTMYGLCTCSSGEAGIDAGRDATLSDGGRDGSVPDADGETDVGLTDADGGGCTLPAPPPDAGSGKLNWMSRYGLTDVAWPSGAAIDPASGNITTAGYYYGTMNFGGGIVDAGTDANADDGFVASFDASGHYRWAKSFGSGSVATGSVAFDNLGNTIMSVSLFGGSSADLGCGVVTAPTAGAVLLVKLDDSGNCVWNKSFATSGLASVVADSQGNILIGGEADSGTVDFGGGVLTGGFYIAKFDSSGTFLWNVNIAGSCDSSIPTLAVDPSGDAILGGCFQGMANFGGGTFTSQGGGDAFIAKYNSSGAYEWAKDYPAIASQGNSGSDVGIGALGIDSCGNVFISGNFGAQVVTATIDFGSSVVLSSMGSEFLAKIDPAGNALWAKAFSGAASAYGVAVDGAGGVITTSVLFGGSTNFGGGTLKGSVVYASFDGDGNYRWAYSPGGPPATIYRMGVGGVAASGETVVILGAFGGSCINVNCTTSPPGSNIMIDGQTLTAVSATDMFLAKFAP